MERETGLHVMEHVVVGFTLGVVELVRNLLMEIGFVGSVKKLLNDVIDAHQMCCCMYEIGQCKV